MSVSEKSAARVQVFGTEGTPDESPFYVQSTIGSSRATLLWGPYSTLADAMRVHDELVATFKASLNAAGIEPRIESTTSPAADAAVESNRTNAKDKPA